MQVLFQKIAKLTFHTQNGVPRLPPAFMRGVPEGRGEYEYLRRKYSEKATFW
jgi:hypothetical protein